MPKSMDKTLNDIMEFDHIIRVNEDLTIDDNLDMSTMDSGSYFDLAVDEDGTNEFDMSPGWTLLSGFTGQYGYNGPVMHASEYVGGGLERHIRETPGYYVVLIVNALEPHVWQESRFTVTTTCERCGLLPLDADDMETTCQSDEPAGWAIAYKPFTHYCSYCRYYGTDTLGSLEEIARHGQTHPVTGEALPLETEDEA